MSDLNDTINKIKTLSLEEKKLSEDKEAERLKRVSLEEPEREQIYSRIKMLESAVGELRFIHIEDSFPFGGGYVRDNHFGGFQALFYLAANGGIDIIVRPIGGEFASLKHYTSLDLKNLRLLDKRLPEFAKKIQKIKEKELKKKEKNHKNWIQFWK